MTGCQASRQSSSAPPRARPGGGGLASFDFAPRDLQLAIVEASDGRIGTLSDRILLYCYQYDPASGRYGLLVMRLLRIGATAVVAALGLLIGHTWWRESGSRRRVRT